MHPQIDKYRTDISTLCRRFDVRRLEVFGSAARGDDFRAESSDVDFLVEFDPATTLSPLEGYFGFQSALSGLLGRPVDLIEAGAIRNPYVLASVERNREVIYAA